MFSPTELTYTPGVTELPQRHFAVLDVETTDLEARDGRICEIAIVRMRADGEVVDEFSTLINPGVLIRNTQYHRISDEDVVYAPTFGQVSEEISHFLEGAVMVAHNAPFDMSFLQREFSLLHREPPRTPTVCTLRTARAYVDAPSYALSALHQHLLGEPIRGAHAALIDARATAEILHTLLVDSDKPLHLSTAEPTQEQYVPPQIRWNTPRISLSSLRRGEEGWLAALAHALPYSQNPPTPRSEERSKYLSALRDTLQEGKLTRDQLRPLIRRISAAGFTQSTLRQAHEELTPLAHNSDKVHQ